MTVATSRGDYSTVTAAVAYVTTQTPSAPAPWTILVYDGDHSAETFTVPPYVAVIYLGGIDPDGDRSGLAVQTGTGYDFALKVIGSTNIAAAGDVTGPASTVDNTIPRYDGTTGKLLQSSAVTMTDAGGLALPAGSDAAPAIMIGAGVGLHAPNSDKFSVATVGTTRIEMSSSGIRTQSGTWLRNAGGGEPKFTGVSDDLDSGLGSNAANDMAMWAGNSIASRWLLVTSGLTRSLTVGQSAETPQAATCADSGDANPGALTINPTTSLVYVTVSDADGCALTMGETNVVSGMALQLVVIAGAGTFSDTPGVTELAGNFTAGQYDALTLRYIADRWVETGRSDN